MDIFKPLYEDKEGFNVNFFKYMNESYLTFYQATVWFVSQSGVNLLKGYYYFYNQTTYYDNVVIEKNIIAFDSVACDKLVSQKNGY